MYIGDIYIPTVSELSSKNAERNDYIVRGLNTDALIPVTGTKLDANPITIKGLLYKETGTSKNADDYAEDLMALEERDSIFNYIHYLDTIGFVSNIKVVVPKDFRSSQIREYEIKAKFFPYSTYQHGLTYRGYRYDDGVYYNYPRMFTLNQNAYNVHLASSIDIIPLTPIAYINNGASPTPTNIIPIFRPFPVLNSSNYDIITGTTINDTETLIGSAIELDTIGEYVQWKLMVGTDIPRGSYKVKFRAKESTNAQDIQLDITGSVSGSIASIKFNGPNTYQIYETATISFTTHEEITIKVSKLAIPGNIIYIDYIGLNSEFSVMVLYDLTSENGYGPVKVYDTIYHVGDTLDSPTKWKRVYSLRHKFIGDIVVQNELMYWRIDSTKTWANTGILKLRDVATAKHLWSYSFSSNYPDIQITEINPYYIELESSEVGDFGIVTTKIIIDSLMFRLEVHKNEAVSDYEIGITKSDLAFKGWHTTLTEVGDNMIASTSVTDGFFCIIPKDGYDSATIYKHLLFDSFNKPTITEYIAKRLV